MKLPRQGLSLFLVTTIALFAVFTLIFVADLAHDLRVDRERFYVRVLVHAGIAVMAAIIIGLLSARAKEQWEVVEGALVLRRWGELDGVHRVVALEVAEQGAGHGVLFATLEGGASIALISGTLDNIEGHRARLRGALEMPTEPQVPKVANDA